MELKATEFKTPRNLEIKIEILDALAYGYPEYKIEEFPSEDMNRTYLIVENINFKEDDGSDPNIVQEFFNVTKEELQLSLDSALEKHYWDNLPKYSDEGRIVVIINGESESKVYKWDIEVLEHDGCTHWIQEGMGFEYFFDSYFGNEDFPEPGVYVIEGITGHVSRGDGWTTDDDEDWEMSSPRKATLEEFKECVGESEEYMLLWDEFNKDNSIHVSR